MPSNYWLKLYHEALDDLDIREAICHNEGELG